MAENSTLKRITIMGKPTIKSLVVLTTTFPRWQGDKVPTFVHDVCEGLVDEFEKVIVVAPHFPGARRHETLDSGLHVHRLRYWIPERAQTAFYEASAVNQFQGSNLHKIKGASYSIRTLIWLLTLRPNDEHVLNPRWLLPHGFLAVLVAQLFRKCRVTVSVHGSDIFALNSRIAVWLKRFTLRKADAVIVNSELTRDACKELYDRHYHVVSSGYDSRLFRMKSNGNAAKQRTGPLKLLSVGRLSPEKGVDVILKACATLRVNDIPVNLTIAGDGPERHHLERLTQDLGLQLIVTFTGWLDKPQLSELYGNADLFVGGSQKMPSGWQEAFGNVYAEAMACGTPVIVPITAGASCLVENGVNGIVVDDINEQNLFRVIRQIHENRAWLSQLSAAAPASVRNHSLGHTIARYTQILKKQCDPTAEC